MRLRPVWGIALGTALVAFGSNCSLGDVSADACTSDDECAQAFGAGSTCDDGFCAEPAGCQTNLECREQAVGTTCQAGACVPATLSPACGVFVPEELASLPPGSWGDRLMIGVLFKTNAAKEEARVAAIELAINEINELSGGISGRPVGAIVCNHDLNGEPDDDVDEAVTAFSFLAGELALPLVIGPSRTPEAQAVTAAAIDNGWDTLVLSPSATGITLSQFPDTLAEGDPGLFWRTCPSDSFQGLRMAQVLESDGVTDVGIVFQQDAYGTGLRDAVVASVTSVNTQTYPFDLGSDTAIEDALASAAANGHDALVFVSNDAQRTRVAMSAAAGTPFETTPWYLTDGSKDVAVLLEQPNAVTTTILANTKGTAPSNPVDGVFRDSLVAEGFDPSNFSFVAHSYDAAYVTAYALAAGLANGAPVTGRALAEGMGQLSNGAAITVGSTSFNEAAQLLRDGMTIDIEGTSGPLDFDINGEAPGEIEVWAPNAGLDGFDQVSAPGHPVKHRYGPTAVVTGAAQGLGAAFARALVSEGLEVILVDRDPQVETLAAELGAEGLVADLSTDEGLDAVEEAAADRSVGLLVNNAAVSRVQAFATADEAVLEEHLAVNVRAPLVLTRRLLPAMVARARGGVILLSSFAAFHGAPQLATYAGTRGFFLSFGESLWYELRGSGVDVLVACPGATDTEGFRATSPAAAALRATPLAAPEETARELLGQLGRRPTHVAGRLNRLTGLVFDRLLPRALATRLIGRNLDRMYPR